MANKKAVVISTLSQNIDNADTLLVGAGIDASAAGALAIGASTATSVVVTPNVGIGGAPTTKLDVTTGQLAVPAGTAAAPGIAIRGDLNNGIYSPAADQLAISTAGTQRVTVDASGNVGIGTSTPISDFEVSKDTTAVIRVSSFGTGAVPCLVGFTGRGTRASPTAVRSGDELFQFSGQGIWGTSLAERDSGGRIHLYATQNWSLSAEGTRWSFTTNPTGGNSTSSAERLSLSSSEAVFNDPGLIVNFRVESQGNANMLFVDGTNNRVGIGTNAPAARLEVSGADALINGLTVGRGNASAPATSTALGVSALAAATGARNTAVGTSAADVVSIGADNTALGWSALGAATTQSNNTAVGASALLANTAAGNTAVGSAALDANTVGTGHVAIGYNALSANVTALNCTAVGHSALALSVADDNTAVGAAAGAAVTSGIGNVALGARALTSQTSNDYCVAVGTEALLNLDKYNYCTGVGYRAGAGFASDGATAVGAFALEGGGNVNTAFGAAAGRYHSTGANNTIVGFAAMQGASATPITGSNNVAIGNAAMIAVTGLSSENVAIGSLALDASTLCSRNTVVGYAALGVAVSDVNDNTAIGHSAMGSASATAFSCVAVGVGALRSSTADSLTAVGFNALAANSNGTGNTALGYRALVSSTTTGGNTAVGYQALVAATASSNTAVGDSAADAITSGNNNVAIGTNALGTATTAAQTVIVGANAGTAVTAGSANTNSVAVGYNAEIGTTSTGQNTVIGAAAGSNITTGTNNVCIGYNAEPTGPGTNNEITLGNVSTTRFRIGTTGASAPNPGFAIENLATLPSVNIGHNINTPGAEFVRFFITGLDGTGAGITQQGVGGGFPVVYANGSDYRLKQDVEALDTADALARVQSLRPVRFHYTTQADGPLIEGFIAHEVQAVVPQAVTQNKDAVDAEGRPKYQGFDQAHLVPLLTAACKELAAKAAAAEARADAAEARLAALEAAVAALQA